jgi:hypothetical protein
LFRAAKKKLSGNTELDEKWDCPDRDGWKMERMINDRIK